MVDDTEGIRRVMVRTLGDAIQSDDPDIERQRLKAQYGQVWNTKEMSAEFTVHGFMAPFVVVTKIDTGERGTLMFQDWPRFYFAWSKD